MNPYSRLIPRLNGAEIGERFGYYLDLVKKGVAGFIVFGGEIEAVRFKIEELQNASGHPLIIASDLEQGLGQQIEGGTIFPPAMAVASAIRSQKSEAGSRKLLRDTFKAMALEAGYAGINTILAPVLDINTNPENPIIATRAFGEDPDTVSFFGSEMIRVLQENGIMACGKHFPGHGDTEVDSHMNLPVIKTDLSSLESRELLPFRRAIGEGVCMIMLGHLSVPAIDTSGKPASLSDRAISYLKSTTGFRGMVITDAMNMGGVGEYSENEASLMALKAGADFVLHPSDPDAVATYLRQMVYMPDRNDRHFLPPSTSSASFLVSQDFARHKRLSDDLAGMAIAEEGERLPKIQRPFLVILDEDRSQKSEFLLNALRLRFPHLKHLALTPEEEAPWHLIPSGNDLIVCIYSQVRAWKGKSSFWLRETVESLGSRARLFISFGNPYVLRSIHDAAKLHAYWDSESSQKAVAELLITRSP